MNEKLLLSTQTVDILVHITAAVYEDIISAHIALLGEWVVV